MVSRNRVFSEDESAVSPSLSDVLLFTTMCIIGHPVDVYVKDGSIYSGTFHTASVDNDYSIVLKKARMIKKGNLDANIAEKGEIETLIVRAEDLVQVVSKGLKHSANSFAGNASGDDIGATGIVMSAERVENGTQTTNNGKKNMDINHINQARSSSRSGKGFIHGSTVHSKCQLHTIVDTKNRKNMKPDLSKKEEASGLASNARNVGDSGLQQNQHDHEGKSEYQKERTICGVQGSNPTHVQLNGSEDTPSSEALSSSVLAASTTRTEVISESYLSTSSTPTEIAPPKISSFKRTAKESKLNPGAKIFSPSLFHQRSVTPPVVPAATVGAYIPDNSVASISVAQPEVEMNHFPPRSLPTKFVPYGGLVSGNNGGDIQYPQPIVGPLGSRTQPIRYAGPYHPNQAGTTYVHPTSQNVMVGRYGPLVYVHPVSHDVVQGASAFSQVSTFPLLTPHQVHLPKHQGSTTAQTLQWGSTAPFVATGQQQFTVPSHVPISQPHFPVIRPMPIPGSNAFLGSKLS